MALFDPASRPPKAGPPARPESSPPQRPEVGFAATAKGTPAPDDWRGGFEGRVRLRTLVLIRWIAVIGQLLALLVVRFGLGFDLPLLPCLGAVGVSVLLNLALSIAYPSSARLSDRGAAFYLAFDVVQLAVLLGLTGGLENPFALLILVPVTIAATILSLYSTGALALLVFVSVVALDFLHLPLPWGAPALSLPELYVAGTAAALLLGTAFIATYAWQVAAEARRMTDALAATQMALAREQQLSALGGLAAAAAHELGTPLGTITLVAKELARELPGESPLAEDVALLVSQAERCREILTRLSHRPEADSHSAFALMPLSALVEAAVAPHRRARIGIEIETLGEGAEPMVRRSAEIVHGLGNLVQNASDFAAAAVRVSIDWDGAEVRLRVQDDGPGIDPDILGALGEPYLTSRPGDGGMGLGIFIAMTLIGHTGGRVAFGNRPEGGCEVAILWPRAILEAPAA